MGCSICAERFQNERKQRGDNQPTQNSVSRGDFFKCARYLPRIKFNYNTHDAFTIEFTILVHFAMWRAISRAACSAETYSRETLDGMVPYIRGEMRKGRFVDFPSS